MDMAAAPRLGLGRQTWNFVRHFVEMCLAMCAGVGLSIVLFAGAGQIGYPDLRDRLPELSVLVIGVVITLPMIAWMRFRGMEWRPIVEMSGAGIGAVIVLIGLGLFGIVSTSGVTSGSICGLECVSMLGAMLLRLDLYTGRTGHNMVHAGHAA